METLKQHESYHAVKSSDTTENTRYMLPRGHEYEIEIRGASIWVVELLVKAMKQAASNQGKTHAINAIVIDFFLWDAAKADSAEMAHLSVHLTRSIYY